MWGSSRLSDGNLSSADLQICAKHCQLYGMIHNGKRVSSMCIESNFLGMCVQCVAVS